MTGNVDMAEFASKTGLTSSQIGENMQVLARQGFLRRVRGGFSMTEKGKKALKAVTPLPVNLRFNFYFAVGHPIGVSAGTVKEFHTLVSKLNIVSIQFHLSRGDFENWFRNSVEDEALADELSRIKKLDLKDDDLRKAVVGAIESKYPL